MPVKCRVIFNIVEEMAPLRLAESWDNSGLQVGDPDALVQSVLLALDVNLDVAREAMEKGAGLIICHHPLLLKPLKSLRFDRPEGKLLAYLVANGINVYAAHTNLDIAAGGVNSALAESLGLQGATVLRRTGRESFLKLAVFVPEDHMEAVRNAVTEAGAGWIGNYSHCTFISRGTGTFKPLPGTKPYTGNEGEIERVEEIKIETIVSAGRLKAVIQAMLQAHPYQEVAYDLYTLENAGSERGLGLVGTLPETLSFREFAKKVKTCLSLTGLRLGGNQDASVSRVAVCGGSGAELWPDALQAGADTLVTGDIKYHVAQDILAAGLKFIDAGHNGSEAVVLNGLRGYLQERCLKAGMDIEVLLSQTKTDPFAYL